MQVNQKLIDKCKRGHVGAQKELYTMFRNHWFTISLRYVNKREDALDVLQNALIKIYTKLNQFDSNRGNFKSWSSRIVVNESIMFQRKYWNTPEAPLSNLELIGDTQGSAAISNLTLEEMTKQIQQLPTGYRVVFNLYEIDGLSHKEISQKLDISIGTSKSQLFKAKTLLKKKLENLFEYETKMIS